MNKTFRVYFGDKILYAGETPAYSLALMTIRCVVAASLYAFLFIGTSLAATVPDVDSLGVLQGFGASPSQLAIAPDGRIYIVQAQLGRVAVYSGSGIYQSAIVVSNPVAVAVSQSDGLCTSVYQGFFGKDF